ncbi:MAG: hypothetical protein AB1941_25280 [Gemmatimonadota bacterium]
MLKTKLSREALLTTACGVLIVLHGLPMKIFTVTPITLTLLVLAALPALRGMLTVFKGAGVEVNFRELTVHEQVFFFLDGIATQQAWTFYAPRADEQYLGPAFHHLVKELVTNNRTRLVARLRQWLDSPEPNLRWFAAEIIGFFRIEELRRVVRRHWEGADWNRTWEPWELNCVWASARFDAVPYASLREALLATRNRDNQAWILRAFEQMLAAGEARQEDIAETLRELLRDGGERAGEVVALLRDCPTLQGIAAASVSVPTASPGVQSEAMEQPA